ncbi:hypothetical protein [Botrimarina hoheduenensis]|uniref:Uncharacterized protein n=1 Tax=Botrimarina hoheduenensis TaxID=2528000 RepID=A0A5C5W7K5_9BACT|nr:hypothetical protein [Botrimarina hoheduenensis]TWT46670.1 hypothetical protein Pla111_17710 [Botrimarina hoheduenensis]
MKGRFGILLVAGGLAVALTAGETLAQNANPSYYGTPRGRYSRSYSGDYRANHPITVPTFNLPVYGGGYYYGPRRGVPYYPGYYYQPPVIYPPIVVYGF